jgi:hypothetical protein
MLTRTEAGDSRKKFGQIFRETWHLTILVTREIAVDPPNAIV